MKGVVLAGGLGSRLYPLTKVTNKHLLPVYNQPMIYYPIATLVNAGIRDIMIVTGGNSAGDFLKLLGNGRDFGLKHLNYTYQEGEGGIADALSLVEHFADKEPICVVLGDNIIEGNIRQACEDYRRQGEGAKILLKKVHDPQRFGVPELDGDRVVRIEEKPAHPKSDYAVIGIYFYDHEVFDIIKTLKPSERGELEITDVNNHYIERGRMTWTELEGWWTDAGTFESLLNATNLVAKTGANKVESSESSESAESSESTESAESSESSESVESVESVESGESTESFQAIETGKSVDSQTL
jgi:glucose-1-phosphate thymidylyltransferase